MFDSRVQLLLDKIDLSISKMHQYLGKHFFSTKYFSVRYFSNRYFR